MECIICGEQCEPWPGGHGAGNNPSPWPNIRVAQLLITNEAYRCCNNCNSTVVIHLRLGAMR